MNTKSLKLLKLTAAAVLAAGLVGSTGVSAMAAPTQVPVASSVRLVPATFNENACVVKLGWNNVWRQVNGVYQQRFGASQGVGKCPRELWRTPNTLPPGVY